MWREDVNKCVNKLSPIFLLVKHTPLRFFLAVAWVVVVGDPHLTNEAFMILKKRWTNRERVSSMTPQTLFHVSWSFILNFFNISCSSVPLLHYHVSFRTNQFIFMLLCWWCQILRIKIITKALATRLKTVTPILIHPDQIEFMEIQKKEKISIILSQHA